MSLDVDTARSKQRLVVVGHGMVSHHFCEQLVQRGALEQYEVLVFGDEGVPAYDRVHLGQYFETASCEPLTTRAFYDEHGIELWLDEPVTRIDAEQRSITTREGREQPYDFLVLATGASPRIPDIPGLTDSAPLVYRSLHDVSKILEATKTARSVGILGGGLLGTECADALRKLGQRVKLYEASKTLLPRQLDAESARVLKERLEMRGHNIEVGFRLLRVDRLANGSYELFGEEREVERCDVLIVAAGVVPRDELAKQAGITCAPLGGIAVSDHLTTSNERIFAIGDCASHHGIAAGLVRPGYEMARIVADRLTGAPERSFPGVDRTCRLKLAGIDVVALGRYDMEAPYFRYLSERSARTLVVYDGQLVGATWVGEWSEAASVQQAIEQQRSLSGRTLATFTRTGKLGLGASLPVVDSWPAETIVCHCTGVTRQQLSEAAVACENDFESVRRCTKAGTVCGSCQPFIAALTGAATPPKPRYSLATALASVLAFVTTLTFVLAPSMPVSASVRGARFAIEALWRSSLFRQTTGFVLVGLMVVGLLISARKRLSWFRWGSFAGYRAFHTWVGVLSVLALCGHTGLTLGNNLNFALMLTFIFASVVGGASGVASYLESKATSPRAGALRAQLTRAHLWLLWPLPALIAFHVVAAYYF